MHAKRKSEHLDITLGQDVSSGLTTGLESYRLVHNALPEINLSDVDLSTDLFGVRLQAPLLISAMTGGTPQAGELNRRLAAAAQRFGLAMGVGSQRAAIVDPNVADSYRVREVAPDILLLANLGAVQLVNGWGIDECRRAVEMIEADALVLHLNPLQEALQPGGNHNFRHLLEHIEPICTALGKPVVIKEVGWGLSAAVGTQLIQAGVGALDVAGAGGTSWSEVERHRSESATQREVAAAFRAWGIPTAESLIALRQALPEATIIASGGLRSGIDAAKALALGADVAGYALPLLKAAEQSAQALDTQLEAYLGQLRVAMFCTGSCTPADLRRPGILVKTI